MAATPPTPPATDRRRATPGPDRSLGKVRREFDALTAEIVGCRRCPLGHLRTNAVVYRGGRTPRVVFVGEAPGAEEDRLGIPFVGRSGRVLDAAVASLAIAPEDVGMLNVLKCRPPGNRFDRSAAATCRPYLDRQLALLRPAMLVTLGAWALRALDPTAPPVLRSAGWARTVPAGTLFPLVHPAATLRSRRMRDRWEQDLRRLAERLRDPAG